jgi:hypothetical protein
MKLQNLLTVYEYLVTLITRYESPVVIQDE